MKKWVILFIVSMFVIGIGVNYHFNNTKNFIMDNKKTIQGLNEFEPLSTTMEKFDSKVKYVVQDIQWNSNEGVANVYVWAPDFEKIILEYIDSTGVDEYDDSLLVDINTFIEEHLENGNYEEIKYEIEMEANKTEDGYYLVMNEELERILNGNLEGIFIHLLEA